MAHVTFIHGIGNKPVSEDLLQSWQRTLAAHDLNLGVMGISSSMAYWADFLYPSPVAREADLESAEAVEDASVPDIGLAWAVEAEGRRQGSSATWLPRSATRSWPPTSRSGRWSRSSRRWTNRRRPGPVPASSGCRCQARSSVA